DEPGAVGGVVWPETRLEDGRADRRITNDIQPVFMGGAADAGNVQHMAVRVARAFKIDIDLPAGFQSRTPFLFRRSQRTPEILGGEAIEPAHRDIEIGAFAVP